MKESDPHVQRSLLNLGRDQAVQHRVAIAEHSIEGIEGRSFGAELKGKLLPLDKGVITPIIDPSRVRLQQ